MMTHAEQQAAAEVKWPKCKGCKQPCWPPHYRSYLGYCLGCTNAGIDERDKRIAELEAEVAALKDLYVVAPSRKE